MEIFTILAALMVVESKRLMEVEVVEPCMVQPMVQTSGRVELSPLSSILGMGMFNETVQRLLVSALEEKYN